MINKKNKNGFTLAEILLAIAIIAVVSTLGFVIAKRGIENAHNMYYYSSFIGLQDAIDDARRNNLNLDDTAVLNAGSNRTFLEKLARTLNNDKDLSSLNGKYGPDNSNSNKYQITASNGVVYDFEGRGGGIYLINVTIPKKSIPNKSALVYRSNFNGGMLMPRDLTVNEENTGAFVNLADRKDLLPTYLDDGIRGKLRQFADAASGGAGGGGSSNAAGNAAGNAGGAGVGINAAEYNPITYSPYRDAYCQVYDGFGNFNCNGKAKNTNEANSIIRVANPKKVF